MCYQIVLHCYFWFDTYGTTSWQVGLFFVHSPVGENNKSGEVYKQFDVGARGLRGENKSIYSKEPSVIFCVAITEYDQPSICYLY